MEDCGEFVIAPLGLHLAPHTSPLLQLGSFLKETSACSGLEPSVCCSVGVCLVWSYPWAAGDRRVLFQNSHGLQEILPTAPGATSFSLTDLGVFRIVSHTFFFSLFLTACTVLFPFLTLIAQRCCQLGGCAQLCPVVGPFFHRDHHCGHPCYQHLAT